MVSVHVGRRVGSLPVPPEAGVELTAVVRVRRRQRQGGRILVIGVSCCAHCLRVGKDPASHWKRQKEGSDRTDPELAHQRSGLQALHTLRLCGSDTKGLPQGDGGHPAVPPLPRSSCFGQGPQAEARRAAQCWHRAAQRPFE